MRSRYPNTLASQYSSPAPTDSVFVPPHFGHDVDIRAGESIPDEARNAQASGRGGASGRSADLQVGGERRRRNAQGRGTRQGATAAWVCDPTFNIAEQAKEGEGRLVRPPS